MYARNVFTTSRHQTIQQIKKKTASLLNAFPFWLNMMPKNVNAASLKCSKMQDDHAVNSDINYTLASKLVSSTKQRGRTEWCKGQKVFWDWAQKRLKAVSETRQAEWQAGFTDSSHTDQALKALSHQQRRRRHPEPEFSLQSSLLKK